MMSFGFRSRIYESIRKDNLLSGKFINFSMAEHLRILMGFDYVAMCFKFLNKINKIDKQTKAYNYLELI